MADERGGKYFREARFFLGGDRVAAQSHIGEARQLLGYMRDQGQLGGSLYMVQHATLGDGTTIRGIMNNGQFQAEIISPSGVADARKVLPFILRPRTTMLTPIEPQSESNPPHYTKGVTNEFAAGGTTPHDFLVGTCEGVTSVPYAKWGNVEWYKGGTRVSRAVSYIVWQQGFPSSPVVPKYTLPTGEPRYYSRTAGITAEDIIARQLYGQYIFDTDNPETPISGPSNDPTVGVSVYDRRIIVVKFSSWSGTSGTFTVYSRSGAGWAVVGVSSSYTLDGADFCVRFNQAGSEGVMVLSGGPAALYLKITLSKDTEGDVAASFTSLVVALATPISTNNENLRETLVAVDYKADVLQVMLRLAADSTTHTSDGGITDTGWNGAFNSCNAGQVRTWTNNASGSSTTMGVVRFSVNGLSVAVRTHKKSQFTQIDLSTSTLCGGDTTGGGTIVTTSTSTDAGDDLAWYDLRAGVFLNRGVNDSFLGTVVADYTGKAYAPGEFNDSVNTNTENYTYAHNLNVGKSKLPFGSVTSDVRGLSLFTVAGKALHGGGVFAASQTWHYEANTGLLLPGAGATTIVFTMCDGVLRLASGSDGISTTPTSMVGFVKQKRREK